MKAIPFQSELELQPPDKPSAMEYNTKTRHSCTAAYRRVKRTLRQQLILGTIWPQFSMCLSFVQPTSDIIPYNKSIPMET